MNWLSQSGGQPRGNWRSPKLCEHVRQLDCLICGRMGQSVAAHPNMVELGKGASIKAGDFVFPLCHECHTEFDNGKSRDKPELRALTWELIAKTMIILLIKGKIRVCN